MGGGLAPPANSAGTITDTGRPGHRSFRHCEIELRVASQLPSGAASDPGSKTGWYEDVWGTPPAMRTRAQST